MKTIGDLQRDAVMLTGLCQGASALFNEIKTGPEREANALCALLEVLEEKAEALADELDRIDCETPKITRTIIDPAQKEAPHGHVA